MHILKQWFKSINFNEYTVARTGTWHIMQWKVKKSL